MFVSAKQPVIAIAIATTFALAVGASWPVSALADPAPSNIATQGHAAPLHSGDLVRLRSGGPLMVVKSVQGDQVICDWGSEDGELQSGSFPVAMLTEPFTSPPREPNLQKDERELDRYDRTHCPREFVVPSGKVQCAE